MRTGYTFTVEDGPMAEPPSEPGERTRDADARFRAVRDAMRLWLAGDTDGVWAYDDEGLPIVGLDDVTLNASIIVTLDVHYAGEI